MILGKFARLSLAAAIAATVATVTAPAHAGGVIGWATAVNDFSTEGTAVGAAAVVLGILAVGAILMFGITGLITTVVMVCLGGALMAKAQTARAEPVRRGRRRRLHSPRPRGGSAGRRADGGGAAGPRF